MTESTKKLPPTVIGIVWEWLGDDHRVLYFWEADQTYYVCAVAEDCLYFLRVFMIGGKWQISQDATRKMVARRKGQSQ